MAETQPKNLVSYTKMFHLSFRRSRFNVYLHNPNAFHDTEMRRRVVTNNNQLTDLYLVEFERIYRLETQYGNSGEDAYTCGLDKNNYNYDNECVYKKVESWSADTPMANITCTTPW